MRVALAILALGMSAVAMAGPPLPGDIASCYHNNDSQKVDYGCIEDLYDRLNSNVGTDGKDGKDGKDGRDGIDGRDGKDGVVSYGWYREMLQYSAASSAAVAYLPQDKNSRMTIGLGNHGGVKAIGLGYAYVVEDTDNLAFTIAVARSNDTVVGNVTVGWEF